MDRHHMIRFANKPRRASSRVDGDWVILAGEGGCKASICVTIKSVEAGAPTTGRISAMITKSHTEVSKSLSQRGAL